MTVLQSSDLYQQLRYHTHKTTKCRKTPIKSTVSDTLCSNDRNDNCGNTINHTALLSAKQLLNSTLSSDRLAAIHVTAVAAKGTSVFAPTKSVVAEKTQIKRKTVCHRPTQLLLLLTVLLCCYCRTDALKCYETTEGKLQVVESEHFAYCVLVPPVVNNYGIHIINSSRFGIAPENEATQKYDRLFRTAGKNYQILAACIFERFQFLTEVGEAYREHMFRCLCNFDLCNHEATFDEYLNYLKKSQPPTTMDDDVESRNSNDHDDGSSSSSSSSVKNTDNSNNENSYSYVNNKIDEKGSDNSHDSISSQNNGNEIVLLDDNSLINQPYHSLKHSLPYQPSSRQSLSSQLLPYEALKNQRNQFYQKPPYHTRQPNNLLQDYLLPYQPSLHKSLSHEKQYLPYPSKPAHQSYPYSQIMYLPFSSNTPYLSKDSSQNKFIKYDFTV